MQRSKFILLISTPIWFMHLNNRMYATNDRNMHCLETWNVRILWSDPFLDNIFKKLCDKSGVQSAMMRHTLH